MADRRDSMSEQKSNPVTPSDAEKGDEGLLIAEKKMEELLPRRKLTRDKKRITDMDCDTDWVTDLWNHKNTGSGKTGAEAERTSGVNVLPASDAKPDARLSEDKSRGEHDAVSDEGKGEKVDVEVQNKRNTDSEKSKHLIEHEDEVREGVVSRRPLLAKLPRSYSFLLFSKVKSASHYQVKIHDVAPKDLLMYTFLEATSLAEGINYTASKRSTYHTHKATYERILDIMAEKDRIQEIMSKVLFSPYSNSIVGFEIWRRETSGSGITSRMDDDALVIEKVFFNLKNSHLRKTLGSNQPLRGDDESRSVYLRNLPWTVNEFLLRCIFPFAVQIIIWRASQNAKSAVIQTACPANVRDCLVSYTDLEINGRSISMSAKDYTQADAVKDWERQNMGISNSFRRRLSNFKPGISKLNGEGEQERTDEANARIEKDSKPASQQETDKEAARTGKNSRPASRQETKKDEISDIERSAKQKSKQEEAENKFQQSENSRRAEARQEENAKAAQLRSNAKPSDQTRQDREDKPEKADSSAQSQGVRTIEESILRLKKSIKPVFQENRKTVSQIAPHDVSSQVSSVLQQIKADAKSAPRSSHSESHGRPVASASPQLSERVSSVLQQIKSQKTQKSARAEFHKEAPASSERTASSAASRSVVEQQEQVHRASEEHPSPQSAGTGVAQVQVANPASLSMADNKGKTEPQATERTCGASHTSERFLGETSSLEPAKIRSTQMEQHGQSFGAEVIDLTSLSVGKGKADKWQKLLPSEAVRQMEKERKEQEKREREKKEAVDRERRREEERKQQKRKREEEREMQKKRVLERKEKPSANQNRTLSGRQTGGTPRVAVNVAYKPSDFGRFSKSEQFMRSEELMRERSGFDHLQVPLPGHADELELLMFEQGLSNTDIAHYYDLTRSAAGHQLFDRDHVMAAASADQTAASDHLIIVNALEQTVAQGLTVEETCTLLVNQLWQRGMPRQEAVIRVQQALASARERHLANQSLDAQPDDWLALPATRGMGHEEQGLLGSGPGAFDRIRDFTSNPYDFQNSAAGRSDGYLASTPSSRKSAFASSGLEKSRAQSLNIPERSGLESSAWNRFDAGERDAQDMDVHEGILRGRSEFVPTAEVGSLRDRRYGPHELNKRDARDRGLQSLLASDGALWGGADRFPAGVGIMPEPAAHGALGMDKALVRQPGPQSLDAGDPATQVKQVAQPVELRVIKDQLQRQVREQAERLQQQIAILESMERDPDSVKLDESLLSSFQDQEHRVRTNTSRPGNEQHRPEFNRGKNTERMKQRAEKRREDVDVMFEEYEKELHHRHKARRPDQTPSSLPRRLEQNAPDDGSLVPGKMELLKLGMEFSSRPHSMEEFNVQKARQSRHPEASYSKQKSEGLPAHGLLEEPHMPSRRYEVPADRQRWEEEERKHQEQREWFWQHRMQAKGLETRGRHAQQETRDDMMSGRGQPTRQEMTEMRDARGQQPRQEGRMDPLDARGQQPWQTAPEESYGYTGNLGQQKDKRYMDSRMKRDPSVQQGSNQGGY